MVEMDDDCLLNQIVVSPLLNLDLDPGLPCPSLPCLPLARILLC